VGGAQCFVDGNWWWNEVQVTSDVVYGSAINPYTSKKETLTLDMYMPPDNDHRTKRPAVVLIHGGAFLSGDKTSDFMPDMAKNYAIRGYVAFSINYRMANSFADILLHPTSLQPVLIAAEDAKAAVRYARANAASLRIDPDRIMIGGHSAGAITSLYYAYMPDAPEGSSGTPGVSSAVQGVAIASGEMKYQAFCDSIDASTNQPIGCMLTHSPPIDYTNDIQAGNEPLLMVHGTVDKVIPYINGEEVNKRAQAVGLDHSFITIAGADHMGTIKELLDSNKPYIKEFMQRSSEILRLAGVECPPNVHNGALEEKVVV